MTYLLNIDSSFKIANVGEFGYGLLPYVRNQRLGTLGGELIYYPTLSLASTSAFEHQANLMLPLWYVGYHMNMFVSAPWRPTRPWRQWPYWLVDRRRSIARPTCQMSEDSYSEVCLGKVTRKRPRQHSHSGPRGAVSQHEWMIQSQPCQSYYPWHMSQKRRLGFLSWQQTKAIEVVAVHGLQGDAYRTWEHDNGSLWLRDFLPEDIPNARIMTFGYDSTIAFS